MSESVKIGGASGFWGDAPHATAQLLEAGGLDFIVYDYLAEITMAILARMRAKDANLGYAGDFITAAMAPNLKEIARQGVRIVSNAGGINPASCAQALRAEIEKQGLSLKVAVVEGDDLMPRIDDVVAASPTDMFTGAAFPDVEKIGSANAYLGAFPIAQALDDGADIVVTGRCVDSAVTLGACIHRFSWTSGEFDKLAAGSLAGHIIECGPQATGGNFTDWEQVGSGLATIGYPIATVSIDGNFEVSKPESSGGLVSRGTVAEQMLYEIGDPQAYLLPDVICDFSEVEIVETGADKVEVMGAKGRLAPQDYKCCLTYLDGWRGGHLFSFYGLDAEAKAQAYADASFERSRSVFRDLNSADFLETSVEIIGAESQFGANRASAPAREVAAKIAVKHPDAKGVAIFLKEATGLALATPPGLSGFAGARPKPSPVMKLFSFLWPKTNVVIKIDDVSFDAPYVADQVRFEVQNHTEPLSPVAEGKLVEVPLVQLAFARSGDKGDNANVGIIARNAEYLPWIWHALDEATLQCVFGHFLEGKIEKYLLPGSNSMNIVLHSVLGGGGTSSLRNDPQGKGYGQLLLSINVSIDEAVLR